MHVFQRKHEILNKCFSDEIEGGMRKQNGC